MRLSQTRAAVCKQTPRGDGIRFFEGEGQLRGHVMDAHTDRYDLLSLRQAFPFLAYIAYKHIPHWSVGYKCGGENALKPRSLQVYILTSVVF